ILLHYSCVLYTVCCFFLFFFFFFSSRRRHTRLQGDWSSDVCSSDLVQVFYVRRGRVVGRKGFVVDKVEDVTPAGLVSHVLEGLRSEERRVGKECRARGWAEH